MHVEKAVTVTRDYCMHDIVVCSFAHVCVCLVVLFWFVLLCLFVFVACLFHVFSYVCVFV